MGFIEVNTTQVGFPEETTRTSLNVAHIVRVYVTDEQSGAMIEYTKGGRNQDWVRCVESYDDVMKLIQQKIPLALV